MSLLYYFASDSKLEECPNPYVKTMSIREARENHIDLGNAFMGWEIFENMIEDEFVEAEGELDEDLLLDEDEFMEAEGELDEDLLLDETEFMEAEGELDEDLLLDEDEFMEAEGELDEDLFLGEGDFWEDIDEDKPNVILVCEDEDKMGYPNIFSVEKEEYYEDIGTKKPYCAVLEWNYSVEEVQVVYDYICRQLQVVSELEVWCRWLGADEEEETKKSRCLLKELTIERLAEFFEDEYDNRCLVIVSDGNA